MSSVLTVTFSPALDKSASTNKLLPEKKLRCSEPRFEPGGGGINVARAMRRLGLTATALYPSGGHTGKIFNQLLEKENVPSLCIETKEDLRENMVILETSTNRQFRFVMPAVALCSDEWNKVLAAIESFQRLDFIVISGSLPSNYPVDLFVRISKLAARHGAKLIVDASGEPLKLAVKAGVYLIKPNLSELTMLANKTTLGFDEIATEARKIIENSPSEIIMISLGEKGAMLVSHTESKLIVPPRVVVKSTVGAGDSMLAGMVTALSLGYPLIDAAKFGVACGTAATMNPGTELCHKEDADRLFAELRNS